MRSIGSTSDQTGNAKLKFDQDRCVNADPSRPSLSSISRVSFVVQPASFVAASPVAFDELNTENSWFARASRRCQERETCICSFTIAAERSLSRKASDGRSIDDRISG